MGQTGGRDPSAGVGRQRVKGALRAAAPAAPPAAGSAARPGGAGSGGSGCSPRTITPVPTASPTSGQSPCSLSRSPPAPPGPQQQGTGQDVDTPPLLALAALPSGAAPAGRRRGRPSTPTHRRSSVSRGPAAFTFSADWAAPPPPPVSAADDVTGDPADGLPPGRYRVTHPESVAARPLSRTVAVADAAARWEDTGEDLPLRRDRGGGVRVAGARLREGQRVRIQQPVRFQDGDELLPGDFGEVAMVWHGDPPASDERAVRAGDEVVRRDERRVTAPDRNGATGQWELPAGVAATVDGVNAKGELCLIDPKGVRSKWLAQHEYQHASGAPFPSAAASDHVAELRMDAVRGQGSFSFPCLHRTVSRELWVVRRGGRHGAVVRWSNGDVWRLLPEDGKSFDDSVSTPVSPCGGPAAREVWMNIYRIPSEGKLADIAEKSGLASYHSGVEVGGMEWWFGGSYDASRPDLPGVECCPPGQSTIGDHIARIRAGDTRLTSEQVATVTERMATGPWRKGSYHLLLRNCNHFSDALLRELGVRGRLPEWANRAARWGGALVPTNLYDSLAREQGVQQEWEEDAAAVGCGCGTMFSALRRRHHCRKCGGVFCGACTRARCILPMHGPHPVRVCSDCATTVSPPPPPPPPGLARKSHQHPPPPEVPAGTIASGGSTTAESGSGSVGNT